MRSSPEPSLRAEALRCAAAALRWTFVALALLAFTFGQSARAQDEQSPPSDSQAGLARKIDDYGKIGYEDLSARLDNFALEVQNVPASKAFIVAYDERDKERGFAGWYLKSSRYYLVHLRGIDPSRVVTISGGSKEVKDVLTELWLVPEGAEPPLPPPVKEDKYSAKDFSGKFDSYTTDEQIYREMVEVGYTNEDVSHSEFAEKLKQQPDSVGYLVIRTSKKSLPGAWRYIARREEQILQKDYNVAAERLGSVNGVRSEDDSAEVELWILPKSAPPPEGAKEEAEKPLSEAVRLNRLDTFSGTADVDAESWMIENIAEALRENPRASACLVAREADRTGFEEQSAETEAAPPAAESKPLGLKPADKNGATDAGEPAAPEDSAADVEPEVSVRERAEKWKKALTDKYGIYSWRVVILEGKKMLWDNGRLSAWLVPENARWPDPLAPDEDEGDEAQCRDGDAAAETVRSPPR